MIMQGLFYAGTALLGIGLFFYFPNIESFFTKKVRDDGSEIVKMLYGVYPTYTHMHAHRFPEQTMSVIQSC